MMNKCNILILLIGIVVVRAKYQCSTTEECTYCYSSLMTYDYECAIENYIVKVKLGEKVEIDWEDNSDFLFETVNTNSTGLFSLNIGEIKTLQMKQCPLPDNFSEFMKQLGIEKTKELQYDYSDDLENVKLTSDYFKGLNSLEGLSLTQNRMTSIDENVFQDLKNLKSVFLDSNELQQIPNIFKFSDKLESLDLSYNQLESFPPNFFHNLSKLKTLHLQSNNLNNVTNETFNGLKSLEILELSNNKISFISESAMKELHNLKSISFLKNNLVNISRNVFTENVHLELVNINKNPLNVLPNYLFANLTKLSEVQLKHCDLLKIPENLFENCHSLQKIFLSKNSIEMLPENIFYHLENLQVLDISSNKLNRLPGGVFQFQTKMKILNLASNDLMSVDKNLLKQLISLEEINFKNNRIESIPNELFQNAVALKEVTFSNNYLKFPENSLNYGCFKYNFQLEKLDLSNNNLSFIESDWILNKANLKELDLSHNSISFVSFNDFDAVPKEAKINLKDNSISRINLKKKVGENMRMQSNCNRRIYLERNPINCDCYFYNFFQQAASGSIKTDLGKLKCASPRNLAGLPIVELKFHMLECSFDQLELAKCSEECDCKYRPSDMSIRISCSNRNLTQVPKLILPKEDTYAINVEVDLSNNLLKSGPSKNMGYENVTKLILSSNQINAMTWMPPKLKVLRLDDNSISHLTSDVVTELNSSELTNITLGNNPWNCDCLAVDLFKYLVSHIEITQMDINNIKCRNGGKALRMLTLHQLCPSSQNEIYIICAMSILILLILITIIIAYNRNKQEIKVWLFAHNLCLGWLSEEDLDEDKIYDVFMSYSHKDEDFVLKEIHSVLESGPNPYKVCLHIRDWIPGESIAQQIVNSVKQSRRTLIVLSPNFLESVWGNMEFQIAHNQAMGEGRARVIVVLYGDINVNADLSEELQAYIKSNTYVKWGDPWFWDKLRYALPHAKLQKPKSYKNNNILLTINDKSELMDSLPATPNACSTPPVLILDPSLLKKHPLMFQPSNQC